MRKEETSINGVIGTVAVLFILLGAGVGSFYVVGPGERAVIFNMFSGIKSEVYGEGFHWKVPIIDSVTKFDTRILKEELQASAASKDLQTVTAIVALNYHIDRASVFDLYREIGKNYKDKIIFPVVQESVKAATAQFTAKELIEKRPEVKEKIKKELEIRLQGRFIVVDEFSIVNFDFSPEFNAAIEASQVASQQKEKAKNDLERVELEAQQDFVRKEAESRALALQKSQITSELLQLRQIEVNAKMAEKWNGQLPTYMITMGGEGAMPLLNMPIPGQG